MRCKACDSELQDYEFMISTNMYKDEDLCLTCLSVVQQSKFDMSLIEKGVSLSWKQQARDWFRKKTSSEE